MAKRRVNLMVDGDVYDRVKAACEDLPGLSVSEVVRDCLQGMAPMLEAMARGVKSGDTKAMKQAFGAATGDALVQMLFGEEDDAT